MRKADVSRASSQYHDINNYGTSISVPLSFLSARVCNFHTSPVIVKIDMHIMKGTVLFATMNTPKEN